MLHANQIPYILTFAEIPRCEALKLIAMMPSSLISLRYGGASPRGISGPLPSEFLGWDPLTENVFIILER